MWELGENIYKNQTILCILHAGEICKQNGEKIRPEENPLDFLSSDHMETHPMWKLINSF